MNGQKDAASTPIRWLRAVAIGVVVGTVVCLLLLLGMAAIMASQDVPKVAVVPMAVIAAAIGGLVCARIAKEKGLLLGLLCGAALYLLILLAGTIWFRDSHSTYIFIKLAILVGCGGVGGVVGVNLKKR